MSSFRVYSYKDTDFEIVAVTKSLGETVGYIGNAMPEPPEDIDLILMLVDKLDELEIGQVLVEQDFITVTRLS